MNFKTFSCIGVNFWKEILSLLWVLGFFILSSTNANQYVRYRNAQRYLTTIETTNDKGISYVFNPFIYF